MGKNQSASNLTNIIKQDSDGSIAFMHGNTMLMSVSSSGAIETTGNVAGTASYAANAELFDGLDSTVFATTGSNTFTRAQYISNTSTPTNFTDTASLYTDGGLRIGKDAYVSGTLYLNNLTVYGTQSVNYITSSQLNIATNIITVNTSTPAVRFGGLAVYDSGSLATGLTGSLLWDSQNNHWVYTNPSGSSYSGGMLISGPRASSLGEEQGTTNNALMKGQGGDHITSSGIFESGSNMGIGTSSPAFKLDVQGTGRFTGELTGTSATFSSTVSGTSGNFNGNVRAVDNYNLYKTGNTTLGGQLSYDGAINQLYLWNSISNGFFSIYTNSTERLTITSGGNVGINSNSPISQLHVRTLIASGDRPTNLATSATKSAVYFTTIAGSGAGIAFGQIAANTNYIQATYENGSSSTPLSLNPYGGKVGIGTDNPDNSYQGLTILGTDPSLRLKTTSASGWVWTEYVNSSGTNNFSMGVNQTAPYFGIRAGAGMDNPQFRMDTSGKIGLNSIPSTNPQLTIGGSLRVGRSIYGWFQSGTNSWDGLSFLHLKTNMSAGLGGNIDYTMSLFYARLYSYTGQIKEGHIGFHNWDGAFFATASTGNIWSSPYRSSDGFVVLVLTISSSSHVGVTVDWHQAFPYPFVDKIVTASSASNSSSGVY